MHEPYGKCHSSVLYSSLFHSQIVRRALLGHEFSSIYVEMDASYVSAYSSAKQLQMAAPVWKQCYFVNTSISNEAILHCFRWVVTWAEYFIVLVSWFILIDSCKCLTKDKIINFWKWYNSYVYSLSLIHI